MSSSSNKISNHPGTVKLYLQIAVILTVVTAFEVAYPYITEPYAALNSLYYPVLGILSLFKFVLVVAVYMNLRYDKPILYRIFLFSMVVMTALAISFLFLFRVV